MTASARSVVVDIVTVQKLAARLSVSEAAVSRDERNEYHGITLERAQRILDALEASVSTTIDGVRTLDRQDCFR